ncbi:MAG TPA: AAA family ATPase, partial [Planctomycetaceae bacterium]|nr:AAA family ATPase [Planctomycetaceae bacterium]
LGKHLFSVNTQALDLTTILRDDELCLHLTGTNFFEAISHEGLLATRDVWDQEVVSENRSVYRGEFLAWWLLEAAGAEGAEIPAVSELVKLTPEELAPLVQKFMGPRYCEGYTKGVHDVDAGNILLALARMRESIGLLRFDAAARVMGAFYWNVLADPSTTQELGHRIKSVGAIGTVFDAVTGQDGYIEDLQNRLDGFVKSTGLFTDVSRREAAEYLFCELSGEATFAVSQAAGRMTDAFKQYLKGRDYMKTFNASVKTLKEDPVNCFVLLRNWVQAWLATSDVEEANADYLDETALVLLTSPPKSNIISATVDASIGNIVGTHSVIDGGEYHLNYNRFCRRLTAFDETAVPAFASYTELKHAVVDQAREDMRLEEFQPRVLTSFVRNKLLNDVYLPLIGDNLAKQIGAAGDAKRTDLMGLLLLISPPGYGKTT